jgi:crossover junction endodeoxyribonuclease RuvC
VGSKPTVDADLVLSTSGDEVDVRVLGIDPGTRRLGWGLVERHGTRLVHVASGVIVTKSKVLADRLVQIDRELAEVIVEHEPDESAVEAIFFAKNAQSASKLGHARGVVLLALRRASLTIGEYPPATVKRAVVGSGRADKNQVGQIVTRLLSLARAPDEDAADALAVAITHLNTVRFAAAIKR